jgi:hypothetical protein
LTLERGNYRISNQHIGIGRDWQSATAASIEAAAEHRIRLLSSVLGPYGYGYGYGEWSPSSTAGNAHPYYNIKRADGLVEH